MTLLLSDSFTEGADKLLSAHAPGTGASWVQFSGPTLTVIAAEGRVRGSDAASGALYYNGGASAADVSVSATVRRTTATINEALPTLVARMQTGADSRYSVNHSGSNLQLQKRVGGTTTTLATAAPSFPVGSDCTLELRVNGQELVALWNGAVAASATDASISGTGFMGIGCRLNGRIDDLVAQTIAWGLSPSDGAHNCASDSSAVAVGYALAPADAASASSADAAAVGVRYALAPAEAGHGVTSEAVLLVPALGPPGAGIIELVAEDARVERAAPDRRSEAPVRN